MFSWQEKILLGIKDNVFAAEPMNVGDGKTQKPV
jgi:hypothetical protein